MMPAFSSEGFEGTKLPEGLCSGAGLAVLTGFKLLRTRCLALGGAGADFEVD